MTLHGSKAKPTAAASVRPLDVHLAQRALAAGESLAGFPPLAREHAHRLAAFVVAVQPLNPIPPEAAR